METRRAQQWEMRSNQEGNDPLGITGHSGEAGSQEEDGRIREEQHQGRQEEKGDQE